MRREHEALLARRERDREREPAPARPGEPDRTAELEHRAGWAWTRVVRRHDEFASLMRRLEAEHESAELAESATATAR